MLEGLDPVSVPGQSSLGSTRIASPTRPPSDQPQLNLNSFIILHRSTTEGARVGPPPPPLPLHRRPNLAPLRGRWIRAGRRCTTMEPEVRKVLPPPRTMEGACALAAGVGHGWGCGQRRTYVRIGIEVDCGSWKLKLKS